MEIIGKMNEEGATCTGNNNWEYTDNERPICSDAGFRVRTKLLNKTRFIINSGQGGYFAIELGADCVNKNLPTGTEAIYVIDLFQEQIVFYLHRSTLRTKKYFFRALFSDRFKPFKVERRSIYDRVELDQFPIAA